MSRSRLAVACGALFASAVIAAPAYAADPCLDDHPAGTAANVVLRGRLAAEKTITADTLRNAVAAGTLTSKAESVSYLQGATTVNKRTYTGVNLYEVLTKLAEPLFGTSIKNPGLRYFATVTANDGYASIIAWGDMDPGFGNRSDILLAYDERNDDVAGSDFVSLAGVGPRLIVPNDVKGGRYVSCVRDVRLASSDDSNAMGPIGPTGSAGDPGPAGPTVQASPGAPGATGATGAPGSKGATGAKGATGRDAKVTCKSSGKTKVRCTVKYANRKAKLTRNGLVYARGTASALMATRKLTRGHYTLRVGSRAFSVRL